MSFVERGKYLEFPESEYKSRLNRAKSLMSEKDIDALFTTQIENILYITGYKTGLTVSKNRAFVAIVPMEADPILILPVLEKGDGEGYSWVKDVRCWGGYFGAKVVDPIEQYVDTFKELGLRKGTIGVEVGPDTRMGMPINDWERFKGKLPDARFVDGSDIIWKLESIKSPLEVERITKAYEITEKSIEAAWRILKEGISEREILMEIVTTMMKNGADSPGFLVVRSGPEGGVMLNKLATDRRVKKGELVDLDLGAIYRDYYADMIRTACIGQPTEQQRKMHKIAIRVNRECMRVVKPGIKISDIDDVRQKVEREEGLLKNAFAGVGHGIGLTMHELPRIGPGITDVLRPGMVFTIEPGFTTTIISSGPDIPQVGTLFVEDAVLVTDNGYRELTHMDRELFVA